ncbi:calcium/sodium antiporter [Denitrobaculum tricleocarpae]|uniref:Calcium/sodium antiporter n=1 Tax=Denitrobaculum tricleocarpae TaxID=2591009 RepID=A0A545U2E0_9PROT|nr:calcium/sodium antiporter [Denitrobaculum tricleocarpae]TQV83573.1 calcium/sodium antiporter [Denitrobaculum tricleocarpae]
MTGAGLLLLAFGGEVLLRGAIGVASRLGLSPMLIGLTVVAFATSMPELVVTVTAGLEDVTDIGVGNVVGSNIANILLILGVAAVISPIVTKPQLVLRDCIAVLAATLLFVSFAYYGELSFLHGVAMIACLIGYVWYSYRNDAVRNGDDGEDEDSLSALDDEVAEEIESAPKSLGIALALVIGGIIGLVLGSELLVRGAVQIARAAGVSETVIGLTLVAFGTSLPELATSITAAIRGHTEVALGNALGSNLFNLLLILGVLAMVTPFEVDAAVLSFDAWIMAAVSLMVVPIIMICGQIGRFSGIVFLLLYGAYITYQFTLPPVVA